MVHVFLQEAINIISDVTGVVDQGELSWATKLALLIVRVLTESVIEFCEKSIVVAALHHKLFFHNLEEWLLAPRLKHIDTPLVVWELYRGYLLVRQLSCIHLGCQFEYMMVELLLKLLVCIVDAELFKWVSSICGLKSEDIKEANRRQIGRILVSFSARYSNSFVHSLYNLVKKSRIDRFNQRVLNAHRLIFCMVKLNCLSGILDCLL